MSGPQPVSLPLDVKELMTVPIIWEAFQGFDEFAQPVAYAAPVTLYCWQEPHGLTSAGLEAHRRNDETVVEPVWDIYFDGDDPTARSFTLYDRFQPNGVYSSTAQRLQAVKIETFYGPNFDNVNPWLIVVSL